MPLGLWPDVVRSPTRMQRRFPRPHSCCCKTRQRKRYDRIFEQLETHGPLALMGMDDARDCDLTRLVEANVLETAEGDFGGIVYSMRSRWLRIDLELAHQRDGFVIEGLAKCVSWRLATNIDSNVELFRRSWTYDDTPGLNPRTLDTPLVLNEQWEMQAKARLVALLGHFEITFKGISAIYISRPQHCFLCLLELEDVSLVETMGPDVERINDDYVKSLLLGKAPAMIGLIDVDVGEPLALPAALPAIDDAFFHVWPLLDRTSAVILCISSLMMEEGSPSTLMPSASRLAVLAPPQCAQCILVAGWADPFTCSGR